MVCVPVLRQAGPRYWKGNLHTHSYWSDGDDFPEMIADWYKRHAYDFLALSDHNVLSEGERWIDAEHFAVRRGDPEDAVEGVVYQAAVARFAIAAGFFGALALGDVQQAAANQLAVRGRKPREVYFDRELLSAGAAANPLKGARLALERSLAPVQKLDTGTSLFAIARRPA